MTFFWSAVEGRSALLVWVLSLVAAAAIAVLLLALAHLGEMRRRRKQPNKDDLDQFGSATIVHAPGELRGSKPAGDGPDWPIKDLFLHIAPVALDYPKEELWNRVGDEIRDALALGRLQIWGRPHDTKLGRWVGPRAALRLIEASYWEKAYFTYVFFYAQSEDVHCYADRDTGRPSYTDLKVNQAQALKLWPGEPDEIAQSYPNVRIADNPSVQDLLANERAKFLGLLSSGNLQTWARPMKGNSDFVRISKDALDQHHIDVMLNEGQSVDAAGIFKMHHQTFLRRKSDRQSTHYDVCLNKAQLLKIWPSLSLTLDRKDAGR